MGRHTSSPTPLRLPMPTPCLLRGYLSQFESTWQEALVTSPLCGLVWTARVRVQTRGEEEGALPSSFPIPLACIHALTSLISVMRSILRLKSE